MHTPIVQPIVLRQSAFGNADDTDRLIAMPAPQKPLALRSLHMLVPRLDTSSPSCKQLEAQNRKNGAIVANGRVYLKDAWTESAPLSPVLENVERTFKSNIAFCEDDAVAELMEIMGLQRTAPAKSASVSSSSSPDVKSPAQRRRKSSVPHLFGVHNGQDGSDTPTPNELVPLPVEPPRLSNTPFKPAATKKDENEEGADAHFIVHSPVSRTKNPLPLNSPFLRRRMPSPLTVSPTTPRGAELGLLSPSPEPRPPAFYRPTHPIPNRLANLVADVHNSTRPRSKSVTDLDGRIRFAFGC